MPRKYTPRNPAQNKADLLALAKSGAARPLYKTYLGNRLDAYLCQNRNYDEQFASEIKFIAPHWFPELRSKRNKLMLLQMARTGQPMPAKDTYLGKQLRYYILKGHSFDPVFKEEIKKYWK